MNTNTICVHKGTIIDPVTKGSITPVYPATSYAYIDMETNAYPRYQNVPNQKAVVEKVAALEKAEDGLLFSSGMAAISTTIFSVLKTGDHAVFQNSLYGGTSHFIDAELDRHGIEHSYTDGLDPSGFAKLIKKNTKLIYIETPSNPLLDIVDIVAIAEIGKKNNILTMIDNTFASPINQNPIELGIDMVIHSATKYLGGHSDICAGILVSSRELTGNALETAKSFGGSLNAETCSLLERSIKTLKLRVEQQNINALEIARFLDHRNGISRVYYPGLEAHPGHEIAKGQMSGYGGMLSFELDSSIDPVSFQNRLGLILPSMSLGGVETIITTPALTSHATISKEQRESIGISDGLLRLSVGIEDTEDLINDIEQALGK